MSNEPRLVKRYANRKLYDTERSCYVTLEDISGMIKAGDEVKVIDNKTGDDLTSITLAQIIFEAEKKKSFMPLSLLRDLIQERGEALGNYARERVEMAQAKAHDLLGTAQQLKDSAQRAREGFEGRVKGSVTALSRGVTTEVEEIRKRLAEVEGRIEKFFQ
jgi:polyhydroxyalkanoate synthesis repressor PhaR